MIRLVEIVDCNLGSSIDENGLVGVADENCWCEKDGEKVSVQYLRDNEHLIDYKFIGDIAKDGTMDIFCEIQLSRDDVFAYVNGMINYLNGKKVDLEFCDNIRNTKLLLYSKCNLLHWEIRGKSDNGLEWISSMDYCEDKSNSRYSNVDIKDNLIYKTAFNIANLFNFEIKE